MIDFIVVEDNLYYINESKKIIDKVMMSYDMDYYFIVYDKYRKELLNKDNFKIYIISYQEDSIKLIKYIREELDDWKSLVIILYKDRKDKEELLKENLFIVDYINKRKHFEEKLLRNIQICLKNYDQRPNSLKYTYKNILYNIEFNKILYIEKEQDNKRCIIYTKNKKYYIPGTLNNLIKQLDNRFIKSSRSYIINTEQISSYDIKSNILTFKGKIRLNCISRDNKRIIINNLRRV
ncbi:MAG: LytTR family transcriptional regulator DNA-binding domain-containing protein [Bacilli bacterium]|nr:LytTR family transcriptional regulator DNA-binding domain-containing protein [Bacilli bacterium]